VIKIIVLIAAALPLSAAIEGPVRVEGGMLAGATEAASGISAFKGISFAGGYSA